MLHNYQTDDAMNYKKSIENAFEATLGLEK